LDVWLFVGNQVKVKVEGDLCGSFIEILAVHEVEWVDHRMTRTKAKKRVSGEW
jgi:hypothetical protein